MKQPNHYYYECEHLKRKRENGGYLHTDENRETDDGRCLSGITGHASKQNRFFINRKDLFPTFFSEYSHILETWLSPFVFFAMWIAFTWGNERVEERTIDKRANKRAKGKEYVERVRAKRSECEQTRILTRICGKNAWANVKERKKERKREHKRETKEAIAPRPNLNL